MEQQQENGAQALPNMFPADILEQLNRREQQLEQLRNAYIELQQQQPNQLEHINKNVAHIPTFTGTGDITINSFISNVEYLLGAIANEEMKKEATKAVYYRSIQGEAKNIIINIPQPDNWETIKRALKLRYRPDIEPHQIYKRIYNLRINNVSELSIEIQNIKYKADELSAYYREDHCIDLSGIDNLLVNTVKEMTQGILLDKIYDERDLGNIIDIMNRRRFEDSCIRPEYKKYGREENRKNQYHNRSNFNNQNRTYNQNREVKNNRQHQEGNNYPNFYRHGEQKSFNNNSFNNSGRYKFQNEVRNNNASGNFQQWQPMRHPRPSSNQARWNPPRPNRIEPMEVENIEKSYCDPRVAGHPNRKFGQNRLNYDRQGPEGPEINYCEEVNNTVFFMKQPQNACQK